MNKSVKRIMSTFLLLALLIGMFGGISDGPDALAAAPKWKMSMKKANYDARGGSYAECANEYIYAGECTTLYFKRTQGPKIPKGAYIALFTKSNFDALRSEGLPVADNTEYAKYVGVKSQRSYDSCYWYFRNGFASGKYVLVLILPYYDAVLRVNKKTYFWWNMNVYNYG